MRNPFHLLICWQNSQCGMLWKFSIVYTTRKNPLHSLCKSWFQRLRTRRWGPRSLAWQFFYKESFGGMLFPNLFCPQMTQVCIPCSFAFEWRFRVSSTHFDHNGGVWCKGVWNNLVSHSVWLNIFSCLHQGLFNPASNNKTHLQTTWLLHFSPFLFFCRQNHMHHSQECFFPFGGKSILGMNCDQSLVLFSA